GLYYRSNCQSHHIKSQKKKKLRDLILMPEEKEEERRKAQETRGVGGMMLLGFVLYRSHSTLTRVLWTRTIFLLMFPVKFFEKVAFRSKTCTVAALLHFSTYQMKVRVCVPTFASDVLTTHFGFKVTCFTLNSKWIGSFS
ncbi:unnamed protein product, partial [Brassica oleracea]